MRSPESKTHSFIVKLWLEETAEEAGRAKWRGHITHVPDGVRRYLKSVHEIPAFITPYLGAAGVKSKLLARPWQWLNRCKQFVEKKLTTTR